MALVVVESGEPRLLIDLRTVSANSTSVTSAWMLNSPARSTVSITSACYSSVFEGIQPRFRGIETGESETLIYDGEADRAWIPVGRVLLTGELYLTTLVRGASTPAGSRPSETVTQYKQVSKK